jgi:hypothetical protein
MAASDVRILTHLLTDVLLMRSLFPLTHFLCAADNEDILDYILSLRSRKIN